MITGYVGAKPKPDWARWQAVDKFGNVMVFASKPTYRGYQWYPKNGEPYRWVNLCIPVPAPETSLIEL